MLKEEHAPVIRIVLADLLLLNGIAIFFPLLVKQRFIFSPQSGPPYVLLLFLFNILWLSTSLVATQYQMDLHKRLILDLKKLTINTIIFTALISCFAFLLKHFSYSRTIIFGTIFSFYSSALILHSLLYRILIWRKSKRGESLKILVIGEEYSTLALAEVFRKETRYRAVVKTCIISNESFSNPSGSILFADLPQIESILQNENFNQLFIVSSSIVESKIQKLIQLANDQGVRVHVVPSYFSLFQKEQRVDTLFHVPIITINSIPLDNHYNWIYKELFDKLFSAFALVITLPLQILIAVMIKASSKGPVLYKVERVGKGGQTFKLLKFRTMVHNDAMQNLSSTRHNDHRITPLGRFLRRSNCDELPQFLNVLLGHMSVVGPRPHRISLNNALKNELDQYMLRHYIKPGITGWAQVNGWRGPTEIEEQRIQRLHHDLWYLRNWTFLLDIKIIFLTLFGRKVWRNAF